MRFSERMEDRKEGGRSWVMTMLELLTIPGLDGSRKLRKLQMESQRRMRAGQIARRRAAAAMSSRRSNSK